MEKFVKLEFYVPEEHLESVKDAIFATGAGKLGDYDCCCWETNGNGQFRPCEGSKPFIGKQGIIEKVSEIKVEMICREDKIEKAITALKKSHPYETPAYQYWNVKI
jgi:hypothetical protein